MSNDLDEKSFLDTVSHLTQLYHAALEKIAHLQHRIESEISPLQSEINTCNQRIVTLQQELQQNQVHQDALIKSQIESALLGQQAELQAQNQIKLSTREKEWKTLFDQTLAQREAEWKKMYDHAVSTLTDQLNAQFGATISEKETLLAKKDQELREMDKQLQDALAQASFLKNQLEADRGSARGSSDRDYFRLREECKRKDDELDLLRKQLARKTGSEGPGGDSSKVKTLTAQVDSLTKEVAKFRGLYEDEKAASAVPRLEHEIEDLRAEVRSLQDQLSQAQLKLKK